MLKKAIVLKIVNSNNSQRKSELINRLFHLLKLLFLSAGQTT